MGDWPRLVNLRRCARGYVKDAGESTNTTVALYNNSLGAELLLVWQLTGDTINSTTTQMSYQQIPPMGTVFPTQAVVPGDAPPPGILSAGDQPNAFPFDTFCQAFNEGFYWPATFPFAVLLPAWSLALQPGGGGVGSVGANFFWEAILPQYFDRMYSHRFLELIIAQQGG